MIDGVAARVCVGGDYSLSEMLGDTRSTVSGLNYAHVVSRWCDRLNFSDGAGVRCPYVSDCLIGVIYRAADILADTYCPACRTWCTDDMSSASPVTDGDDLVVWGTETECCSVVLG